MVHFALGPRHKHRAGRNRESRLREPKLPSAPLACGVHAQRALGTTMVANGAIVQLQQHTRSAIPRVVHDALCLCLCLWVHAAHCVSRTAAAVCETPAAQIHGG